MRWGSEGLECLPGGAPLPDLASPGGLRVELPNKPFVLLPCSFVSQALFTETSQ